MIFYQLKIESKSQIDIYLDKTYKDYAGNTSKLNVIKINSLETYAKHKFKGEYYYYKCIKK